MQFTYGPGCITYSNIFIQVKWSIHLEGHAWNIYIIETQFTFGFVFYIYFDCTKEVMRFLLVNTVLELKNNQRAENSLAMLFIWLHNSR